MFSVSFNHAKTFFYVLAVSCVTGLLAMTMTQGSGSKVSAGDCML